MISDYFKKVVTIPLLDNSTVKIERRLDHTSISVYCGLVIIPSKILSIVYKNVSWEEKFISWSFQRWFSWFRSVGGKTGFLGNILARK